MKTKGALFTGQATPSMRLFALVLGLLASGFFVRGLTSGTIEFIWIILAVALVGYGFGAGEFLKRLQERTKIVPGKHGKFKVLPEYQKWRDYIFGVTEEPAGVSSGQPDQVYGVIVDVGLVDDNGNPVDTNHVITQTAFATGESSLKTSFGGGVIFGIGGPEDVSELAKQIVRLAQPLLNTTKPINTHDLPESGKIYFYFLTTSGVRFYGCRFNEVYSQQHPFSEIMSRFGTIKNQADGAMNRFSKE